MIERLAAGVIFAGLLLALGWLAARTTRAARDTPPSSVVWQLVVLVFFLAVCAAVWHYSR